MDNGRAAKNRPFGTFANLNHLINDSIINKNGYDSTKH